MLQRRRAMRQRARADTPHCGVCSCSQQAGIRHRQAQPEPLLLVGQASVTAQAAVGAALARRERAGRDPAHAPHRCAQNWQLRPPLGRSHRRCGGGETARAAAHGRGARAKPQDANARPHGPIPRDLDPKRAKPSQNAPKLTCNSGSAEANSPRRPLLCAESSLLCTPEAGNPPPCVATRELVGGANATCFDSVQ